MRAIGKLEIWSKGRNRLSLFIYFILHRPNEQATQSKQHSYESIYKLKLTRSYIDLNPVININSTDVWCKLKKLIFHVYLSVFNYFRKKSNLDVLNTPLFCTL